VVIVVIMATEARPLTLMEKIHEKRVAIAATAVPLMTVGLASAGTLADNVTPIIDDVVDLLPSILDLVVAVVPVVIALAVSIVASSSSVGCSVAGK
jgi:hypothetical protein